MSRYYNDFSNFLEAVNRYKTHIVTGLACFFLGSVLTSSCSKTPAHSQERPEPPYPVAVQVYRIEDCNEGKPVARAIMSDRRIELLTGDNNEGTSYTNLRTLDEKAMNDKKTELLLKKQDIEARINVEKAK